MDPNVLFIGTGTGGIFHYRSKIPSMAMGASFIAQDQSGKVVLSSQDDQPDPDVAIIQMPILDWQVAQILRMQGEGIKVLVNVDDYLPAVRRLGSSHSFSEQFTKGLIRRHEKCLTIADGVVASTPWLATRMRKYNKNVYICGNGLDLGRYDHVDKPIKDTPPIIGWSGGTGHLAAFRGIAGAIRDVMWENDGIQFVSVGEDFTELVNSDKSLEGRCHHLKWADMYVYPENISCFDIAVAPSESNDFFRAKSQLRYYESGAMSIPTIGSPLYDEIVEGVTGFVAYSDNDWFRHLNYLVNNREEAEKMGKAAREDVVEKYTDKARVCEWEAAVDAILHI